MAAGMERVRELAHQVSNWGRWGKDDERGTLNLITSDVVLRASRSVQTGEVFSLGLTFGPDGPQTGTVAGRFNPEHTMSVVGELIGDDPRGFCYSDDVCRLPLQCATQWDSLAHVHYDGLLYNGFPAAETLTADGAARNGIDKLARNGIVSRGVLLDLARAAGVERLAPSTVVTPADLDRAVHAQRVTIEPGDILVLRTGHVTTFTEDHDRDTYLWKGPGLGIDSIPWLRALDVAAVCADNTAIEVMPCEDPAIFYPVHMLGLRDMGMPFGEMFNLEMLAAACAVDGRWEFMLSAPPLPFDRGIGSPVNPLAIR